jgi:hypothetical protein
MLLLSIVCSELYNEIALSWKPFGIEHIYIYTFLLRMTDTMTSQNIGLSPFDTLYMRLGGPGADLDIWTV